MKSTCIKPKTAFTLIEMCVVMALLAIMMMIVGAILVGVMQLEGAEAGLRNRNLSIAALSNQFRNDVRASSKVEIIKTENDKGTKLKLESLLGEEIIYTYEKDQFLRRSSQGGQRLLSFSILENVVFNLNEIGQLVEFKLLEKGVYPKSPVRTFSFRAALNGDRK